MSLKVNIPPEWSDKRIAALQAMIANMVESDPNIQIELYPAGSNRPLPVRALTALSPQEALL